MEQSKNQTGGTRTILLNGAGKESNWGEKNKTSKLSWATLRQEDKYKHCQLEKEGIKQGELEQ